MVSILFINQWFIQGRGSIAAQPVALRLRAPIQLSNHILPQLVARPSIHTCNSQGFIPVLSWERVFQSMYYFYTYNASRVSFHPYSAGWNLSTHELAGSPLICYRMLIYTHGFHSSFVGRIKPFYHWMSAVFIRGVRPSLIKQSFHSVPGQGFPSIMAKFHSIRSFISCKSFITVPSSVGGKTSRYAHAGIHSFFLWAEFHSFFLWAEFLSCAPIQLPKIPSLLGWVSI